MRKSKMKRWIAVMLVALLVAVNLSGFAALADVGGLSETDESSETEDSSEQYEFGSEQGDAVMNPEAPDEFKKNDPNEFHQ